LERATGHRYAEPGAEPHAHMEAPAITRRHRPFLAPIWLSLLLFIVAATVAFILYQSATTTTLVIVRHLESAPGASSSAPHTAASEERAQRLAQVFSGGHLQLRIRAIYVTGAQAARALAAPLAARLGVHLNVVQDAAADTLESRVLSEHRGESVLIVANASVVSQLVEDLCGIKLAPLDSGDPGAVFVVSVPTLGSAGLLELHY